jgi:hypothetical protein
VLVGIAVWAACVAVSLRLDFDPGDSLIELGDAQRHGYLALLTKPSAYTPGVFEASFAYRPLMAVLSRLAVTSFGVEAVYYRAFHLGLLLVALAALLAVGRRLEWSGPATVAALLYFAATPFTSNSFFWWADLGSLLMSACYLAGLCLFLTPRASSATLGAAWIGLPLLALGSKESGVIVCALLAAIAAMRRQWSLVAVQVAIVLAFVAVRSRVVGVLTVPSPFLSSSGFLLGFYDRHELEGMFGRAPALFYAYNVAAQLVTVFVRQPLNGQLVLTPRSLAVSAAYIFSSALVIGFVIRHRRRPIVWILLGTLVVNAAVSAAYARDRVLSFSGCAYAVLLGLAVTGLAELELAPARRRAVVTVVLATWAGLFAFQLAKVRRLAAERAQFYREATGLPPDLAPYEPIVGDILARIRARYR